MEPQTYYLLSLGVGMAALAWTILAYRLSARKSEITDLKTEIKTVAEDLSAHKEDGNNSRSDLSQRLSLVEKTLEQMPSKDMVHDINVSVVALGGDLREMGASQKAMVASVKRIEDFLMDGLKGK